MHVTAQSTNLDSVPVNQQQLFITLESHAAEPSVNSNKNTRDKKITLTSENKEEQQHGNLDEEVCIAHGNNIIFSKDKL